MRESEIPTAILISGEGTTAEAVIRACQSGEIARIRPAVVIASRHDAPGIWRAEALDIRTVVVARRGRSFEAFGDELLTVLGRYGVDLVSQNGWLPLTPKKVVDEYRGRIINQHPGRLPAFGGKGMFGARVTAATIAYFWLTGEAYPWTASVIHHVSPRYDEGPLIQMSRLPLTPWRVGETVAALQENPAALYDETRCVQNALLPIEHDNVKRVLLAFGERTPLSCVPPDETIFDQSALAEAKRLAVQLYP